MDRDKLRYDNVRDEGLWNAYSYINNVTSSAILDLINMYFESSMTIIYY